MYIYIIYSFPLVFFCKMGGGGGGERKGNKNSFNMRTIESYGSNSHIGFVPYHEYH